MALFQPGQSGNPGGRSKAESEIKRIAQEHGPAALEKLVQLLNGEDQKLAMAAANALLDRGFGKPAQSVDLKAEVEATVNRIERAIVRPAD